MSTAPSRSPFRERLGTYFLGVAIGCMIAGFIFYGRYQEKKRQAAIDAAQNGAQTAK
jgi:hypothetical protein